MIRSIRWIDISRQVAIALLPQWLSVFIIEMRCSMTDLIDTTIDIPSQGIGITSRRIHAG